MDYEYVFDGAPEPQDSPPRQQVKTGELTSKQRVAVRLVQGSIRQLELGTTAEQHTAALLSLVVDAIGRGYEAELVALARAWRREVEAGSQP